jgi:hypothetical protein
MRTLINAVVLAALAAFFFAGRPVTADAPCAYTFDEAVRRIIESNEDAVMREMTADQVRAFAAALHLPEVDRAAWFASEALPTIYVLVGVRGCARAGGEFPPERFVALIEETG